ncbi:MAG: hypothetical protein AB7V26_06050 [Lysobacterales bacterium]
MRPNDRAYLDSSHHLDQVKVALVVNRVSPLEMQFQQQVEKRTAFTVERELV